MSIKRIFFKMVVISTVIFGGCKNNPMDQTPNIAQAGEEELTVAVLEALAWGFPVRYGTEEWKTLKTVEEQFNAYNIPDEIIKTISTEELVKICLNYPEWGLMNAYNSRSTGFSVLVDLFNGFRELFSRDDAASELLKVYEKLDPLAVDPGWTDLQQGEFGFEFTKIEMFFNQKVMIDKLDNEGLKSLKKIATEKYQNKKMMPKMYSLWNLSPTAGIFVYIIEKENASLLENRRSEINSFKYYMMSENIQFLDSIVEL